MTDFLFCYTDNNFYSNTLANWSSIKEGQKIELLNFPNQFTVVKNDIISFYKDFTIINENTLEINSTDKGIVLDGDNIDVYFEVYGISLILDITNGGTGYKAGDLLEIHDSSINDHEYGGKDYAEIRVLEVSDGAITNVEIEYDGNFFKENSSVTVVGGSGTGCILSPIYHKKEKKLHKLYTAIDAQFLENKTRVILLEKLEQGFSTGEIVTKRHRLTMNTPLDRVIEHYPFFVLVNETPFLNLPLANKENIAQLYNQAILTIDKKIQELS